jgi:hypothetical protein
MAVARFLICERSGRWAVALRGVGQPGDPRVWETRSPEDCWRELEASPHSIVAVEATIANVESLVRWMKRVESGFPRAHVIVLAQRGLESGQWLLREAGARHVVFSPRDLRGVARMVRRHLAAMPADDDSTRQRIWRQLPWGDHEACDSNRG